MRDGTRKLFGDSYPKLVEKMTDCADTGSLPVSLTLEDIEPYTLKDLQDLLADFREDTLLEMEARITYCDACHRAHLSLDIDYPDYDEEEHTLN